MIAAGAGVLWRFADGGSGTDAGQSYPDYLQADLDELGYRYRVDNQGISGNTTKDGVERLPDVLALHPAVVVVEFGGNDGLRGLPIEDTRANLDEIVGTLKRAGIKVALAGITLPPDYGPDYIREVQRDVSAAGEEVSGADAAVSAEGRVWRAGDDAGDRTHATAKGNEVVARNVLQLVVPLLKK